MHKSEGKQPQSEEQIMFQYLCFLVVLGASSITAENWGNPCSKNGVAQGKRYFAFPGSSNKFIQCNEWGGAYIVSCREGYEWSQEKQTCVMTNVEATYNEQQGSYDEVMEQNGQTMNGYNPNMVSSGSSSQQDDYSQVNILPFYGSNDQYGDMNGEYVSMQTEEEPMSMGEAAYGTSDGAYADMDGEYVKTMQTEMPVEEMPVEQMPMPTLYGGGLKPSMYGYMKSGDSVPSRNPIHLITCTMTKLSYMPHYLNPHWYYECVHGAYKLKQCSPNEMWSQKRHRCEPMGGEPSTTTAAAPTTTTPMPSTAEPSTGGSKKTYYSSPCLSPYVKFMPYPGDQQRYVACHSKYSWEVRWCGDGEIWLNPLARCISISDLLRTTEKPTPPPVTAPTTTVNPMDKYHQLCRESDSFYHPYEEDRAKYIQCDEFKKAYLRECGPQKVWDDERKTCVGSTEIPSDSTTTMAPPMTSTTTEASSGVSSNSGNTIIRFSTSIQTTGEDDLVLDIPQNDPIIPTYHPCPHNTLLDPFTGECRQPRQDDYHLGPNCADGYLWDTRAMMCIQEKQGSINDLLRADIPDVQVEDAKELQTEMSNPCETGEGFYFPMPGQPNSFIQCDQVGQMHVMPCPTGLQWSQAIKNCVASRTKPKEESTATATGVTGSSDSNQMLSSAIQVLCKGSNQPFHANPLNPQTYIICGDNTAYIITCPHGTQWDDSLSACH